MSLTIHVHTNEGFSDEEFERRLTSEWKSAALYFYHRYYSMDGHDPNKSERALLRKWKERLIETIPEEFKVGCHLLEKESAALGEDIYVFRGVLQHTMQRPHEKCGDYSLLYVGNKRCYCVKCNEELVEE